jgi:TPR repeat protein
MTKATAGNLINFAQRARELRMKRTRGKTGSQLDPARATTLGLQFLNGEGVARNIRKAAEFLAVAANGGSDQAKRELALLHLEADGVDYDPRYAIELLQSASDEGHVASAISLAEIYVFGNHCPRDVEKALDLLHMVVLANEPAGMYYLAYIYDKDPELKNHFEAAYWYRRAAEHGHFKSQIRLACLYATGRGVPCCRKTAEVFLELAMESSHEQDPGFLLWQGERLEGQPETQFLAHALIKAAAAMRYPPAQRLLLQRGLFYRQNC